MLYIGSDFLKIHQSMKGRGQEVSASNWFGEGLVFQWASISMLLPYNGSFIIIIICIDISNTC